jgi:class 3 adenylate cyclase
MGLGLHYGPVVAGDIGRCSMAFATVGDTTNVTRRLQALTRDLGAGIVASAALAGPRHADRAVDRLKLLALPGRGTRLGT